MGKKQKIEVTLHASVAKLEGDKRQYFPYVLRWTCPCGQANEHDLKRNYLSYPLFGENYLLGLYCPKCEREDEITVVPHLTLEVVQ